MEKIVQSIGKQDCFIFDCMSLEICKDEYQTALNRGCCALQATYYYGCKLHTVYTIDGVFIDFDLCQASVHYIHSLKDIK